MTFLGRGHSNIKFEGQLVLKTSGWWEPTFMMAFPEVFIPVKHIERSKDPNIVTFTMPRWEEPDVLSPEVDSALIDGAQRLRWLWGIAVQDPTKKLNWKHELEAHLLYYIKHYSLDIHPDLARYLVQLLPDVQRHVLIHGDPTLANILFMKNQGWRWIDPLDRTYIPGDPHVDLGKMYQSILGYEEVLVGARDTLVITQEVARRMTNLAVWCELDPQHASTWMFIHLIRLLPYQQNTDRKVFEKFLRAVKT